MIKRNLLRPIFIMLFSLISWIAGAQTGIIKGTVIDSTDNEPLIGVVIRIQGTEQGQVTDLDGAFSFSRVEPGTYTLEVSSTSYQSMILDQVKVLPNAATSLNLIMVREGKKLDAVVVSASRVTSSQVAVISEIKNATQVVSGISSEQIKLSQDRDAAQVMSRVPGVTIVENRFVMVRGIPERYNQVILNNVIAPSTEVDRRTFSFDLIPSNVLDRMMIYKSGTSDNVGDFAGGLTKIYTKNNLDEDFASVSISTGYRSGTTFDDFQDAPGGSTSDLFGFDTKRGLPESFPATADLKNSPRRSQIRQDAGRSLDNSFVPNKVTAIPNLGANFSFGKGWNVGGSKRLTTITSLNYSQTYQYYARDFYRYFTWDPSEIENNIPIQKWFDYVDHTYEKENRIGLISNWQLKLNAFNKIDFRNLYNQIGENSTVIREGVEFQQFAGQPRRNYMMGYRGRSIYNGQVEGTHNLSKSNSTINWVVGVNYLSEKEPDLRRFRTFKPTGDSVYNMILPPSSNLFDAGRYYGNLQETGFSQALNFDKRLGSNDNPIHLKVGYLVDYRTREFNARYISYLYPGQNDPTIGEQIKRMPLDEIFAPENIKVENGLTIEEGTRNIDQYSASNLLGAGYINAIVPLGKFNFNVGGRLEYNVQKLDALNDAGAPLNVNNAILSPLWFLNADYKFSEKQQLRMAYGRTINRPEFRELAPFMYYDFKLDASKVGNPNLQSAYIHNFDLRYEFYPRSGEALSVGAFYKHFINPIETQIFVMTEQPGLGYTNAGSAYNYGVEVEVRKSMSGVTSSAFLNNFSINLNASLIASKVTYSDTVTLAQESERALQGQSPYIVNANLDYNDKKMGLQVSAGYNIFGPRIYAVGSYIFPTIYELPRHAFDLTLTKSIGKKSSFKIGVQDLLNSQYRFYQDSDLSGAADVDIDHPIFTFRRGALYTATFTYTL